MTRVRALVALLSCLAVLAGSFAVVAEASAATRAVFDRSAIDAQPCSHCDDCDGMPCPKPTVACLQVCSAPAGALPAVMADMPTMEIGSASWSTRTVALDGLSRPPDPFPPRL